MPPFLYFFSEHIAKGLLECLRGHVGRVPSPHTFLGYDTVIAGVDGRATWMDNSKSSAWFWSPQGRIGTLRGVNQYVVGICSCKFFCSSWILEDANCNSFFMVCVGNQNDSMSLFPVVWLPLLLQTAVLTGPHRCLGNTFAKFSGVLGIIRCVERLQG